jgi:nitroreductase
MTSAINQIRLRRSVRSYTGEPLRPDHERNLREFIASLEHPFGGKTRIEYLPVHMGQGRVKLGTYGVISGAPSFIAMVYEPGPLAKTGAAAMFERVALHCAGLGIGTCWLGGAFSRGNFKKHCRLSPTERLPIVSPVGYPSAREIKPPTPPDPAMIDRPRKPFGATFFNETFNSPLSPRDAQEYYLPLEMVRLAPSANNMQPWRVVSAPEGFHFYKTFSYGFASVDIGIAICHFEETCRELNLPGRWQVLESAPPGPRAEYVISWVRP